MCFVIQWTLTPKHCGPVRRMNKATLPAPFSHRKFRLQPSFRQIREDLRKLPPVSHPRFWDLDDQTLLSCISVQVVRTALNTAKEIVKCLHNFRHVRRGIRLTVVRQTHTVSLSSRNHHTNNLIWIPHYKYMSGVTHSPSPGDVDGTQKTHCLV